MSGARVVLLAIVAVVATLLAACEIAENPRPPAVERPAPTPAASIVNRAWLADDAAAAPGTLRVFLEDGTLLMTSCVETYRIARWEVTPDGGISWSEDGAGIEAAILHQTPDSLVLALDLVTGRVEQRFISAAAPFVCPSTRP